MKLSFSQAIVSAFILISSVNGFDYDGHLCQVDGVWHYFPLSEGEAPCHEPCVEPCVEPLNLVVTIGDNDKDDEYDRDGGGGDGGGIDFGGGGGGGIDFGGGDGGGIGDESSELPPPDNSGTPQDIPEFKYGGPCNNSGNRQSIAELEGFGGSAATISRTGCGDRRTEATDDVEQLQQRQLEDKPGNLRKRTN
uniref:Uncharacterized protein n=1 Tax=Craspedostauros australis TaxID=1486917 RepID=A0A7R9WPT2_9STRA|mmetsp:Transcript_1269/g.3669  ORF Transcript_1269/g.3669 Transcript_1269/m.3669 type:complete len:193 (+) Transcript_1269:401-979(+)|eukprot:CAMPEP_0198108212 /NCGR_PEP_ID=MMETSP1442-20131203/287_1 /TAXON_ID= /ORGANISM="Craspedostauros australis, Strain CCMP3328" /LENGTH=192 /DNA_ID=CAMNT_0043763441 /DNA_START=388 /DNA_END=966 /DNA_ORIENTATION=-